MTTPVNAALGELGAQLRELRELAGMTGAEFAAALGGNWRQPKISKIETGRQLPTEAELHAWARATGGDPEPLVAMRVQATGGYGTHKDRISRAGGAAARRRNLTALIESCAFQATFAPRSSQADYRPPDTSGRSPPPACSLPIMALRRGVEKVVAEKLRRQSILYEPGREFVHVVTEAALRLRLGAMSVTNLRGQLGHLAELATLPGHTFGVLPFSRPCPVETLSGFQLYDRELVRVETNAGVLELTDADAVSRYVRWLGQLLDVALTGADAADFCRQVARSLPED